MSAGKEVRAVAEMRRSGRSLTGYAATFGTEARIANFTEVIAAGAFASSLSERGDILALVDHAPTRVLGRTKTGTLELREDDKGLAFNLDVPDTQAGNDVLALAERGDLGGMSFGFTAVEEQWEGRRRELRAVDLREISVVAAWPAYDNTVVAARFVLPRVALARRYLETV